MPIMSSILCVAVAFSSPSLQALSKQEAPKPKFVLKGHQDSITALAFDPDGKRLVSSGPRELIRLWDVVNGKEIGVVGKHFATTTGVWIYFTPDGKKILTTGENRVDLWDAKPDSLKTNLKLQPPEVVMTFNMSKGKDKLPIELAANPLTYLFSPDGQFVARRAAIPASKKKFPTRSTTDPLKIMNVWNVQTGELLPVGENEIKWLRTALSGVTEEELNKLTGGRFQNGLHAQPVVSASRRFLAMATLAPNATKATVKVWDIRSGQVVLSIPDASRAVALSLDGTLLATAHRDDNTIRIWELPEPKK
jgi:WD40 repeat protein